jgi:hypothetical protein
MILAKLLFKQIDEQRMQGNYCIAKKIFWSKRQQNEKEFECVCVCNIVSRDVGWMFSEARNDFNKTTFC